MGVNTIIQLPLHVRADYVLQVIAKVVGEPWTKGNFGKQRSTRVNGRWETIVEPIAFDPERPPSPGNPWHLQFERLHTSLKVQPADTSHNIATMIFTDLGGERHGWYWHTDDPDEQFKTLSPGAHALAVAVGRRLVAFFGGQIIYSDATDKVNYKVSSTKARLPKKKAAQTSDDRWYQFYELLAEEPLLTAAELRKAIERMGSRDCDDRLLAKLEIFEKAQKLDQALPAPSLDLKRTSPRL